MISEDAIKRLVTRLSTLKFFPTKPDVIDVVTEGVVEFAATDEQLDWLGRRMLKLYTEWPGLREMRAVFCSRFTPKDGLDIDSETFPAGVPSERPQLPAPPLPALPPGHTSTCDAEFEQAVQDLARMFTMPEADATPPKPREDPPPIPEPPRSAPCPKCGGPGTLSDGSFCDCAMGRDLAGVARRRPELFRVNGR